MKHLALLIPTIDKLAGAEQVVLALARAFAQRGWQVTIVALTGEGGSSRQELFAAGIDFYSLQMRRGLADSRGWWRFHQWLRRTKPDLLHTHLPHAAFLARWSRLLAPVPAIIDTMHSSSTGNRMRRFGYRSSNWLTDAVTTVSAAVQQTHLNAKLLPRRRTRIIFNGVNTDHWRRDEEERAALRSRWGIQKQFVWIAGGRLETVKDYPTLLLAMSHLPDAVLFIAGCGSQQEQLQNFIDAHHMQKRVHLIGFQQDLIPWLSAADGFVQSSLWEGMPLALLEAGSCSLPCVATDVAGNNEILVHGQTGFLVPGRDPLALATAMNTLMKQTESERAAMGNAARERIMAHFEQEKLFHEWESIYSTLLAHHCYASRIARQRTLE